MATASVTPAKNLIARKTVWLLPAGNVALWVQLPTAHSASVRVGSRSAPAAPAHHLAHRIVKFQAANAVQ